MFVSCEDHIEHVIEAFIDEFESSPDIYLVEKASMDMELPLQCHFCEHSPVYVVI